MTMTLTDFLLARIDEDEAAAREASEAKGDGNWLAGATQVGTAALAVVADTYVPEHIARHDPARVLAECESKRRIVERCRWAEENPDYSESYDRRDDAIDTLRDLASVYADHPDYNPEWRP